MRTGLRFSASLSFVSGIDPGLGKSRASIRASDSISRARLVCMRCVSPGGCRGVRAAGSPGRKGDLPNPESLPEKSNPVRGTARGSPSVSCRWLRSLRRGHVGRPVCPGVRRRGGRSVCFRHSSNLSPVFGCRASLRASAPDCRSGGRYETVAAVSRDGWKFPRGVARHEKAPPKRGRYQ